MGLQDFMAVFSNLDPSCKGFVTSHQVLEFCQSIYHSSISVEQIEHAITQICGSTSSGRVSRQQFIAVLEEIERRRSVEEQAYWDFQALDYKGTNRISLKDALMMFREFHGDRFSLYTWKEFLKSRDDPGEQVYFDEIRLWLCNYPSGEPASKDQITQEEEQLIKIQSRHQSDTINKLKQIQDDKEEIQEYLDNAQYNAQRRRNKWDKQGLEAMLFDDGLEADDDTTSTKSKDTITMSDVNDAMTQKYDKLKSKLLWEMAKMSAAMESDRHEIFQQLCREEKQYSREGSLQDRIGGLSGSRLDLIATLTGLMGEVRSHDFKRKEQAERKRETLRQQGMKEHDIDKAIQTEYQGVISGDTTCGATLINLIERFKLEKEETMMAVKSRASMSSVALENEYYRLLRQHLLLTDEWGFPALAMAVGLAERPQQYRSTKGNDWDRNRSEQLSQIQLEDRKGRKLQHTPADLVDSNKFDDLGLTDLKQHLIKEIVQKHFYEKEAMINMLQGRESEQQKKKAHQMSSQERKKRLKVLRNQQISWSQSNSDDTQHLHQILTEAVAIYCEVRREELLPTASVVTDNVVSECVLADLIQRQEVEYEASLEQFVSKQVKSDVVFLIKKENKMRIKEHFDNISFVALGTIEISAEDKDYVDALDVKYDTLRKNILRMGLEYKMGTEWKQLNEKERKKYIKEKEKEERKLRGLGQLQDMESLIGPKALPSLRQLIGEEKTEYEKRLQEQRKTGQNQADEPPAEKFPHMNVLADLVPRYDNEQEALLIWLKSTNTKQLPVKTQRLKIVLLKLETFCAQLEEDFEVSALSVGLMERLMAALQNRHPKDQSRQYDLAMRRTRLRFANLQQKEPTKKKEKSFTPEKGDLTGWQTAYLYEVMKRHYDEREQLLKYLQDESITELMEAASEMSADERKSRLAELQTKRRKLDLANSGDKEDYISILEEAVAISAIGRKSGRTSMDEVTVTTLRDLQDRQDRELAKLLQNIENVTEEQLETKLEEEKYARQQGKVHNVFDILTQTDDSVKEDELIMALEKKYSRLQDSLLSECLCQSCGKESWDKMTEKDKLVKLAHLKGQVKDMIQKGDHVGLKGLVDVITLEKSVRALMGIHRHQFLQKALGDDLINEEEITDKMNPILEIHHRNQEEVDLLLQMIKGSGSMFMDEAEQQIHLIRLKREVFIGSHFDFRFATVAMVMGLAERQQATGKPKLVDDRQRIEMVAIATMQNFEQGRFLKKKDVRDEVMRGPGKHLMTESVIVLLDRSHQDEQQYLLLLLTSPQKPDVVMEIQSWSQQQRKDQLWKLHSQRQEILAVPNSREFNTIYSEGVIIKKEIYRHRLNNEQKEEVDDEILHKMLLADLLSQQNCDAEKVVQSFIEEGQDFIKLQTKIIEEKRNEVRENIAIVLLTSETCDSSSNEETEILEALDGKYDALRDKLLAEVLMKQLGETEWNRLSELERQKKLAELKLKERQLRRDGKYDEVANIIGAALEDQETLDRLFGDSKEEQERKMKERLHKRKQRLASGMSEKECDELEAEEIKQEEEEEKKKRRNILLDLDKRCEQEKEELMRRLREQKDRVSLERQRQLELMKLKHDEKKARREEKFNSAALVIGRAKDEQKRLEQNQEDERQRQERLAKERLEAARKRRGKKLTPELETVTDMEDKSSLQDSVGELIDKRHRQERDLLIQLLDDATTDPNRQSVAAMTEEERQENLERIRLMRSNWRSKDDRNKQDQTDLLKEAAVYLLESKLHQMRTDGLDVSDDKVKVQIVVDFEEKQNEQKLVEGKEATDENVKVQVLSDLQEIQDGESKFLLTDLYDKDLRTLQQMVKLHRKTLDNGNHDNVSSVVLGDDDVTITSDDSDVTEDQIKKAVEQKYDILKGKLLEATLIMQVGENEWSKLSEKEREKRLIELKMKEKKLRQEGKNEEATALFENLVDSDEFALENLFGEEEIDEEQKAREREERKKELQKEREEQGLPIDDAEIDKLLDEEETEAKRQKRRNVLDGLQMMLEDEKAALLRQLKEQVSGIDQERQRQLALVKLKMDKKKMEREEKYDSVALVLKLAKEADEKRSQNITADRERQKALAKERLEALRRKKQQKNKQDNLEQRLKEENENNKLLDAEMSSDVTRIQAAILDTIDKTHTEERELLMELVNMALQNKSLSKTANGMEQEDLKTELSKLEQDHSKWKKKSQQIAMSIDDSTITQKEENKHLKDVANNRKEQTKLLSDALVYRMELEERSLKTLKPELSSDQIKEELSVILLADLQDQQERDSTAVQNIIQKQQSAEDLNNLKRMQRLSEREGWFNNLSKTLFQLSSQDDGDDSDESTQDAIEKRREILEKEITEEREAKLQEAMRAKMAGEEIDIQAELKQLEKEQQAKRKALDEELAKQKQALKDKINKKKRKGQEKEEEEIEAYHILMLQQSQAEKSKQAVDGEKSRQSSKLQDKIRLRKEERIRLKQEAGMHVSEEESNSRPSTVDSKKTPPLFALHREKTVVNVDITEDQKQAVFNKLVREQTSLHDKIKQQQEQQQEMLRRRLDKSRGKKEMQAKEIMDMSERQKKEYHKTKTEERDRQLQQMQQKIAKSKHRARSRSPNNMGASPIPEDQVSEINFADISHLTNLLENLVNTFKEFKAHEQIENKYIMKKLKDKLRALSVRNTAVCNCHSDNQLTDILELVQDGYKCTQKTETDRKNFGTKLRKALEDFTETFIPHMEEEEAVFQPMLIKYFTTDELRKIKYKVLEKHFCQNDNCAKEKFPEKTDFVLSDSSDEECTEKLEPTKEDVVPSVNSCVVDKVPDEVAIQIFSYLNPQDLGRCAQVSPRWNRLALDTSLWRNFLPIQWSKGVWSFTPMVDIEVEEQSLLENKDECVAIYYDEDADIDESEEDDDTKRIKKIKMETSMLMSMMKYLLPKVGYGVKTINLAFSQGLVNGLLYKMLSLCPLVENLDLTHTRVSDLGFKSLGRNGCGGNLKRVDLAGCKNITDVTLERLSQALRSKPEIRQEDCDDNNHEEKNEIELNEKGDKSSKDSDCHVTCRQNIKEQTVHEDCNISFTNDIEDHSPRMSESLANQKGRSVDLTLTTPTLKVGYITEESPRLTLNTGNISSFGQRTSLCCPKNCCFDAASVKHFDQHSKNMNFKCLTDIDELTKICAVKHGHESEIICDNLECGLEYLSLSGCSHITDKGIRALVIDQQTFPSLQFLDLSGCDKVTSLALTDLVSVCTSLDHQFLYYCDNVRADPYSDSASGCQNLECPTRACCRTGC